jgi:hypothetical protein
VGRRPIVAIGLAIALGYDWRKPSSYGLTRAGPPPLRLVVFVIVGLALIVLASAQPG